MATTINADTSTGGAIVTGDASGVLGLQAAGSTQVTISTSGVVLANPLPVASGGTGSTTGVNLASGVTGTLPIANGGTGTTSTTFASLTTNVTGTLPIANGGTNSTATATAGGVGYGTGTAHAYTSAGTSGQVLTSAGSGAPTWATPAAGGSWVYLSTVTASNSATIVIDTTFDSTYQVYALVVSNLRGSAGGQSLTMVNRLGASYITSADYIWHVNQSNNSSPSYSGQADTASYYKVMTNVSANSYESAQFIMYIHNPASTASFKGIYSIGTSANTNAYTQNMIGYCGTGNTSALTALRFAMGSGNIVDGTFRLYGIKNS